ncbi:DUF192 domain-containing protein [Candidatus Dojkabacteria bacterium]|nr:DUF192 domain-containing protein [Candidatus Dojkabacteria bacterium]
MLFNWNRLKKIVPLIVLVVVVTAGFAYWEKISGTFNFLKNPFEFSRNDNNEKDSSDDNKKKDDNDSLQVEVVTDTDRLVVKVEEARTPEELGQGLMYRENLCENCGMVFYFKTDRTGGFWMKNCEIPLDIIFIDSAGEIVDIKRDFEPCNEEICPSYTPMKVYRYALEVNAGWCEKNDVEVGDKVEGLDP